MKKQVVVLVAVLAIVLMTVAFPSAAFAQAPTLPNSVSDVELVNVYCGGNGLIYGWTTLQADETAWGYAHNLTTLPQWTGTWPDRMNDISRGHGCGPLIDSFGNPTLFTKTMGPWLELEYASIYHYFNPSAAALTIRK